MKPALILFLLVTDLSATSVSAAVRYVDAASASPVSVTLSNSGNRFVRLKWP